MLHATSSAVQVVPHSLAQSHGSVQAQSRRSSARVLSSQHPVLRPPHAADSGLCFALHRMRIVPAKRRDPPRNLESVCAIICLHSKASTVQSSGANACLTESLHFTRVEMT